MPPEVQLLKEQNIYDQILLSIFDQLHCINPLVKRAADKLVCEIQGLGLGLRREAGFGVRGWVQGERLGLSTSIFLAILICFQLDSFKFTKIMNSQPHIFNHSPLWVGYPQELERSPIFPPQDLCFWSVLLHSTLLFYFGDC